MLLGHKLTNEEIQSKFPGLKLRTDSFQRRMKSQLDKGREKIWNDSEHIEKMRLVGKANMSLLNSDPAIRKKAEDSAFRARMNHAKSDPEWWREVRSKAALKCWQNPSRKEAHSNLLKSLWTQEDYRSHQSDRFRKIVSDIWNDPEKAKELFTGYRTYKSYSYLTKNEVYYFRSSWERRLAEFLDKQKIQWEYESISIPYEFESKVHRYIPDFILPEYKTILEVKPLAFVNEKVQAKLRMCEFLGYKTKIISENLLFNEESELLSFILE